MKYTSNYNILDGLTKRNPETGRLELTEKAKEKKNDDMDVIDNKIFRLVALESPYAGKVEENIEYARKCLADCLKRGEAPFASHLLYTQPGVLNDDVPKERKLGIAAGFAIEAQLDATVVYVDLGISEGMIEGILRAQDEDRPIEFRKLNLS